MVVGSCAARAADPGFELGKPAFPEPA